MHIYDGAHMDTTNFFSPAPLAIDSCGTQRPRSDTLVLRDAGRVDYHILFVRSGTCTVEYEGASHTLSEHDFVVYLPHQRQCYRFPGEGAVSTFWLHFSGTEADAVLEQCRLSGGVYHSRRSVEVSDIFHHMIHEYRTKPPLWEMRTAGLLMGLLCELSRSVSGERHMDEFVAALVEHIHENYAGEIDVDAFAVKAGLSRSHFDHLFRTQTGKPPHQYQLGVRLREASWLVRYTDLGIAQIAEQVGFSDPFYFSRLYKKKYGVSPKRARDRSSGT